MLCHGCHSILRCPLSFKHAGYFEHGTIHCFGFSNLAFSFVRDAYFACCHNQRILPLCSWLAVYIREHSSGQLLTPLPAIRFADLQPPGSSCSLISMLNLFLLGSQRSDWYKKFHPCSTNSPSPKKKEASDCFPTSLVLSYLELHLLISSSSKKNHKFYFLLLPFYINLNFYVVFSLFFYLMLFCALSFHSDQLEKVKKNCCASSWLFMPFLVIESYKI